MAKMLETPQTCRECVNSEESSGGGREDSPAGIATTVVGCISKKAKTLYANMTTLASHEKDKKLKSVCLNCSKNYSDAVKVLENWAKQALKHEKYDDAERLVVKALGFEHNCCDHITKYKSVAKVPDDAFEQMNKYEQLSEAVCPIIERL